MSQAQTSLGRKVAGSINIVTDWPIGQQELWIYGVASNTKSGAVPLTVTALNNQLVVPFDSAPTQEFESLRLHVCCNSADCFWTVGNKLAFGLRGWFDS